VTATRKQRDAAYQDDLRDRFQLGDHSQIDKSPSEADGAVATHADAAARIHEDHAVVSGLRAGGNQESAEHVPVPAWLAHDHDTEVIVMCDKVDPFLSHGLTP
jgi:hypothetical protein